MMGICLTYSLLNPYEVSRIKAAIRKEIVDEAMAAQENPNTTLALAAPLEVPNLAIPQPLPQIQPRQPIPVTNNPPPIPQPAQATAPVPEAGKSVVEPHALHPALHSALVPYQPPIQANNVQNVPDIDLQALLQEFHNEPDDDAMIIAAAQVDTDNSTTKALVKKTSSPHIQPKDLFQNCSFNNVGTINIHIHKA